MPKTFHLNTNSPSSRKQDLIDQKYFEPKINYRTKEGGITTDISLAELDVFGSPTVLGLSDSEFNLSSVYDTHKPLSFNPSYPENVALALEARVAVNNNPSSPAIYMDNIDAVNYANNSANAFIDKYNHSLNSETNV